MYIYCTVLVLGTFIIIKWIYTYNLDSIIVGELMEINEFF